LLRFHSGSRWMIFTCSLSSTRFGLAQFLLHYRLRGRSSAVRDSLARVTLRLLGTYSAEPGDGAGRTPGWAATTRLPKLATLTSDETSVLSRQVFCAYCRALAHDFAKTTSRSWCPMRAPVWAGRLPPRAATSWTTNTSHFLLVILQIFCQAATYVTVAVWFCCSCHAFHAVSSIKRGSFVLA